MASSPNDDFKEVKFPLVFFIDRLFHSVIVLYKLPFGIVFKKMFLRRGRPWPALIGARQASPLQNHLSVALFRSAEL
jgi:hypothetical protein